MPLVCAKKRDKSAYSPLVRGATPHRLMGYFIEQITRPAWALHRLSGTCNNRSDFDFSKSVGHIVFSRGLQRTETTLCKP